MKQRVIDALDEVGALERAFISTGIWNALQTFRKLAPTLRTGWTVPGILGVSGTPLITPSFGRLYGRLLPRRAAARIRAGQIDALVPNWRVVTPALVDGVLAAGGEIYVWTVDDAAQIRLLADQGVTGVITNDPRLFCDAQLIAQCATLNPRGSPRRWRCVRRSSRVSSHASRASQCATRTSRSPARRLAVPSPGERWKSRPAWRLRNCELPAARRPESASSR